VVEGSGDLVCILKDVGLNGAGKTKSWESKKSNGSEEVEDDVGSPSSTLNTWIKSVETRKFHGNEIHLSGASPSARHRRESTCEARVL